MNIEKLTVKFVSTLRDTPKGPNQWAEKSAQEICEGLKFSKTEFKSVIDYAFHGKLIEMTGKKEGHDRVRLGVNADEWLSKNTESWSLDRRLVVITIIVGLVGVALAYMQLRKP
jgi:hypothetical protein